MSESKEPSIKLQKSIKDKSLELQDFIADLHKWEKDVKDKEKQLSPSQDTVPQEDLPPVRCRKPEILTQKIVTENRRNEDTEPKKKKERISSYDYAAWDKFDVDKELGSSEEEETSVLQKTPNTQVTTSSLSKTPPSHNQKERATKLKDEGNKCYSKGRLEDAVAKYTQGMALDPTNSILPANRAMAYIKLEKYEAAEADCNRCLKFDANYIKAYLRRGTSRLKLQKLELAAEDFKKVLELEPWNKDAKKELERLESGVESQTNGSNMKAQKIQQDSGKVISHQIKESGQNVAEKKRLEETSLNLNSQKNDKVLEETNRRNNENKKEQGIKKKKDQGKRKKVQILEVDSSQNQHAPSVLDDSETVTPVVKLPHQRSQKPLKRIQVVDVLSEDTIPKELPSSSKSKNPKVKDTADSRVKDSPVATKSQAKANVPIQKSQKLSETQQKPSETPAASIPLPSVPRTSHQFSQDWQRLTSHQPRAIEYLKTIPLSFFRGLDLESETLVDLVSALRRDDFTSEQAVLYLGALIKSDGFSVNIMFLNDDQKKVFYEVIEKCKDQEQAHSNILTKLKTSLL